MNSWLASVDSINRWWSGPEPRRGPFFGVGTAPSLLPQAQAEIFELELDLVDRLLAEVADVHQFGLRLLHDVADRVDALALQAVVGAHRQVELLDRDLVVARELVGLGRTHRHALRLGEVGEEVHELEQRPAGGRQRLARRLRTVGLDIEDQLVAVGHLLDAGVLDRVADLSDRRKDRVDRDHADRIAGLLVLVGHAVPDAALDGHLHLERPTLADRGEVQVGVQDLDAGGRRPGTGGDLGRTLGLQVHRGRLLEVGAHDELLQVQDDVGDVLGDLGNRRELMQHAVDPDRRDRRPGDRRQQRATERVPNRVAEPGLERLDREPGAGRRNDFFRDLRSRNDEQRTSLLDGGSSTTPRLCGPPVPLRADGSRSRQTRRRLRGRQPLCGTGVTSWIPATSSPAAARDRIAVSRPEPGPFTNTSTFCRPCSCAARAAFSAASCAANGVDLREPLNPTLPALAHDSVLPCRSVMVTIVLLNVDLMCACPCRTFFFSRRLVFLALGFAMIFLFPPGPSARCRLLLRRADRARAVILVEGASDRDALEALAIRRGRMLAYDGVAIVAIGGSKNIARALGVVGVGRRLAGLCDAREERDYRRGLEGAGFGTVSGRGDLEAHRFFVCEPDLEGELIGALGVEAVVGVLARRGELTAFRTFQRQPAWRSRPEADQLRRFLGTHSGRKIGAAPAFVRALDLHRVPPPLDAVLASV